MVEAEEAKPKNQNRVHVWGAVGYGFKSDLIFYITPNKNGKLSHRVYLEQILEPILNQ